MSAAADPPATGPVWAIVVAGGSGTRFGAVKQYEILGGRRVVDHALAAAHSAADGVVLVVPTKDVAAVEAGADRVVAGGRTRADSVRAGLVAVPSDAEVILVHDAARPLATPALFRAIVSAVRGGADAAVPGVAVADTLRRIDGGVVDRDGLVAVQTPQGFRAAVLRAAHEGDPDATDDATLVERAGGNVVVVPGEAANRKVTEPDDLALAAAVLAQRMAGDGQSTTCARQE